MPIKGLHGEEYIAANNLYKTASIDSLVGERIGVEGTNWVKKININEPFQVAMGGIPLKFNDEVKQELEKWSKAQITPLLVFSGLGLKRDNEPKNDYAYNRRKEKRDEGWVHYAKGDKVNAEKSFNENKEGIGLNFIRNIIPILEELNVQYIHAPYLSFPQLAWFEKNNMIDGAFGGLELLLFGASKVITTLNFESKTCTYVKINDILDLLKVEYQDFLDICLLVGSDYTKTLTGIGSFSPLQLFIWMAETVRNYGSGYRVVTSYHDYKGGSNDIETFVRARCMILHHPILEPTCQCEPLVKENCPNDLMEIFGFRLPPEIYFFLSQGIVTSQAINNLIQGYLFEAPPLVDSKEYRKTLDDLKEIRTKTLALISTFLHEGISQKPVFTVRWFAPFDKKEMGHSKLKMMVASLNCMINEVELNAEKERQQREKIGIKFVVDMQLYRSSHKIPQREYEDELDVAITSDEMKAVVLLQALELLGYLDTERSPSPYSLSLSHISPSFAEYALLVIELLRHQSLSGNPLQRIENEIKVNAKPDPKPDPDHPSDHSIDNNNENNDHEREITLISRVLSVLPMSLKGEAWHAHIDHDLMGVNSIYKAFNRSLRNLLEMLCLSLYLRHKAKLPNPRQYIDLALQLPFYQESNTALGVVVKSFLKEGLTGEEIKEQFPACTNPIDDLKRGFLFWDEIVQSVHVLHSNKLVSDNLRSLFDSASLFLHSKIPSL